MLCELTLYLNLWTRSATKKSAQHTNEVRRMCDRGDENLAAVRFSIISTSQLDIILPAPTFHLVCSNFLSCLPTFYLACQLFILPAPTFLLACSNFSSCLLQLFFLSAPIFYLACQLFILPAPTFLLVCSPTFHLVWSNFSSCLLQLFIKPKPNLTLNIIISSAHQTLHKYPVEWPI